LNILERRLRILQAMSKYPEPYITAESLTVLLYGKLDWNLYMKTYMMLNALSKYGLCKRIPEKDKGNHFKTVNYGLSNDGIELLFKNHIKEKLIYAKQ